MIGQGKVVGSILIIAGLVLGTVCSLWLFGNVAGGQLQFTGLLLRGGRR